MSVFPCTAWAGDAVKGGELILERPTMISLGFEWRVEGDDNYNAQAQVQYRKIGETKWHDYLPLYRIGRGMKVVGITAMKINPPEAVAGSIMDLEPGTAYEVRLELTDPDGVDSDMSGCSVRSASADSAHRADATSQPKAMLLKLRTRPIPEIPAKPVEVRHVYPPGYEGQKEKPFFKNIMHAVNGFAPMCDAYQVVHPKAAPPGTVIKVHGGVHKFDRYKYWNFNPQGQCVTYWLHGTITLRPQGTAEQPIYVVGAGDGEAIFDGDGCFNLFNLRGGDYTHFENLTIRNTDIAFHGGWQGERGGGIKGLTVKNCWIENVVYGILSQDGRSEDFYIADNVILGRRTYDKHEPWGRSTAGYAVNISGQGHVACHNYAAYFWDGINVGTMSLPEEESGQQSRSIDFYNNDIHNCGDNIIETDGGYANLRVLRNRGFNCFTAPISCQNVFAGPVYIVRNVVWNSDKGRSTLKSNGGAQVYVYLHNTSSAHFQALNNDMQHGGPGYWHFLNNIHMGPSTPDARGRMMPIAYFECPAGYERESDYNLYRSGNKQELWKVGKEKYASIEELRKAAGLEKHSMQVNRFDELFANAAEPSHKTVEPFMHPHQVDLTLKPGSPAVDAGTVIPGINDNFTGKAPDLGAYETGRPLPVYGPRTGPYRERLEALRQGAYVPEQTRVE